MLDYYTRTTVTATAPPWLMIYFVRHPLLILVAGLSHRAVVRAGWFVFLSRSLPLSLYPCLAFPPTYLPLRVNGLVCMEAGDSAPSNF